MFSPFCLVFFFFLFYNCLISIMLKYKQRENFMSDKDFQLLKFISKNGSMALLSTFRENDIVADARLANLEQRGYIKKHVKGSDSSYAGDYEVTGSGYAVLVDYFESRKKSLKIFLLTDVFIPAIIAFLTVIFTSYIQ
jgi:hypothetical protein|nr:MAG TPA: putative HTH-type transcriptional regulator [Caudoviricetes sp.]DAK79457.1 MAG TPA: putative HTH-type transcriptional regulator [Caudoviricetes sp.]